MGRSISIVICICLFLSACMTSKKKISDTAANALPPKLLSPSVKKIWMPPIIKNGGLEWEEGHYLYRIERETTWSR